MIQLYYLSSTKPWQNCFYDSYDIEQIYSDITLNINHKNGYLRQHSKNASLLKN